MSLIDCICRDCIKFPPLKEYVTTNYNPSFCNKCKKEINPAISYEKLFDYIEDCIRLEYDNPENGLGWVDGGWVDCGNEVIDSYDLLYDHHHQELQELIDEVFIVELISHLSNFSWCEKRFYGLSDAEEKVYSWKEFSEIIKHHTRYFFLDQAIISDDIYQRTITDSKKLLGGIAETIEKLELIEKLPKGKEIFRARFSSNNEDFSTPTELGPPPATLATQPNRMSPPGISMFYGSDSHKTCIEEIKPSESNGTISIAAWELLEEIHILDLTKGFDFKGSKHKKYCYTNFPSIFDYDNYASYADLISFIEQFSTDLSKPICHNNNNEHNINYIPTQVIAEYFRRVFNNVILHGICYYSAETNGKNYALFFDIDNCIPSSSKPIKQYLRLNQGSILHEKYYVHSS